MNRNGKVIKFGIVGVTCVAVGALLLHVLVSLGVTPTLANFIQAVCAIELNFFLNAKWTWSHNTEPLFPKWRRFHVAKVVTVILNQVLFALMTASGIHYMAAYFLNVGIIMVINFIMNEFFVFKSRS